MSQKKLIYNWSQNLLIVNHVVVLERLFKTEDLNLIFHIVLRPHLAFFVSINIYFDAD